MKKKINLRLIGMSVLAVIATMLSVTFLFYGLFQKQVQKDLRINAEVLRATGLFQTENKNTLGQEALCKDLERLFEQSSQLRITWIDEDGTVLYDNDTQATRLGNHARRPEVQSALETGVGEVIRRSDTMNMNTFYYALRLDNGTVLRVATEARNIGSMFGTVIPVIVLIIGIIILLCILLAQMLTRQLLKPIETMAQNMEDSSRMVAYKELIPFMNMIRTQHENILSVSKSRQDFTANVSHELKTPLTAISGYAELIENHMVDPEKESHFAEQIRKNADRLLSLINDIIRLSELDHGGEQIVMEQIDLYEMAENSLEPLQVSARQKNVVLRLSGEHCMIRGNRTMIQELIDNLCQNAIRYNVDGGKVIISVEHQNSHPVLRVQDTGIGIPKDQQERVFERFYRVDKSRSRQTGGTGLGLAIVKHIVELHEAQIFLESEQGKGTIIWVEF